MFVLGENLWYIGYPIWLVNENRSMYVASTFYTFAFHKRRRITYK